MEINKLKEWAKREIELAKGGCVYTDEYYDVAYNSFCAAMEAVSASGIENLDIIKTILIQLIQDQPITPIEDNGEDWELLSDEVADYSIYHCKRRKSLFKKVMRLDDSGKTSKTIFTDKDRCTIIDINNHTSYKGGIGSAILDEMIPIKMPYLPLGSVKVYVEEFLYDEKCLREYDTIGVLYYEPPIGSVVEIKRYFKYDLEPENNELIEILESEYLSRKNKYRAKIFFEDGAGGDQNK